MKTTQQTQDSPKFTSGEWKWKQIRGNNNYEHKIYSNEYDPIALLGMDDNDLQTPEEIKANARLIAEAKNMYQLLESIVYVFGMDEANYPEGTTGYKVAHEAATILNRINNQ